ncbi:MAG: hypothetical protein OEV06_02100 [Anaerolineae bacterium]|nr:hypothetical protein [Anaerolineae bacterium]
MNYSRLTIFILTLLALLAACGTPAEIAETPAQPEATFSPIPTFTPAPPQPSPTSHAQGILEQAAPKPGTVALDFVALTCSAAWSSSIQFNPCPGDPDDLSDGYIEALSGTAIESGETTDLPALLTIPPQADGYGGIFGRYPSFTVQPGDRFRAVLTCQQSPCGAVEYALDYFDAAGKYSEFPSYWPDPFKDFAESGHHIIAIDLPLDFLAGQTVDFTLVIRDQSAVSGDRYLWIAPHIYRDPANTSATPLPQPGSSRAPTPENAADNTPGIIRGLVDMKTAPPYLNDPITTNGLGVPVVVVFFNLDDGTWWWVHTTATHPNFQMTVTPGRYVVLAYAPGVADIPYITGAYTGGAPSCGQPLVAVEVPPNGSALGIFITDWCEYPDRPEKPPGVPIP